MVDLIKWALNGEYIKGRKTRRIDTDGRLLNVSMTLTTQVDNYDKPYTITITEKNISTSK